MEVLSNSHSHILQYKSKFALLVLCVSFLQSGKQSQCSSTYVMPAEQTEWVHFPQVKLNRTFGIINHQNSTPRDMVEIPSVKSLGLYILLQTCQTITSCEGLENLLYNAECQTG